MKSLAMMPRTAKVLFGWVSALSLAILCQTPIADVEAQTSPTCAPFPAFPDSNCTGWAHTGVTLTNNTGSCTLSTAGAVYDSVRFNCRVIVNANNITIKRSEVNGAIDDADNHTGLLVEDTLIDCGNDMVQGIGHSRTQGETSAGFTARRVEVKNCSWGFYAARMTVEDSFCHEIYGTGAQHNECVLAYGPGPHSFKHNTFFGEYNSASSISGGGMSSAVSFYVHGDFWADITQGVLFEQNFLRAERADGLQAGFCLYGGASTAGDSGNTTNGIFRSNVFARGATSQCGLFGPVTGPASGPGSCWSNNRYDDGTTISVSVPACPGQTPRAPTALTAL